MSKESVLSDNSVSTLLEGMGLNKTVFVAVIRRQIWAINAMFQMLELKRAGKPYSKFKNTPWAIENCTPLDELVLKPIWESISLETNKVGQWRLPEFMQAMEVKLAEKITERDEAKKRDAANARAKQSYGR